MPSQEKTQNLGLNQWKSNEYVKRQDFVEDNVKIDEAFGVLEGNIQNLSDSIEAQGQSLGADFDAHKADSVAHGVATQTEARAGTLNEKYMTPLRTLEQLKWHFGGALNAVAVVEDWNDASNLRPGISPYLLRGNYTNGPISSSGYFHVWNICYGTLKDNTESITQIAIPYGAPALTQGMHIRCRYGASVWSAWTPVILGLGGVMSGELDFYGNNVRNILRRPQMLNYTEFTEVVTGVTGPRSINMNVGNVFRHTLSGSTTYSITNPAASGQVHSFTLIITQPGTAVSITFPASVKWAGGTIPNAPTANKTAVYTFFTFDGGTTWIGSQAISEVTL